MLGKVPFLFSCFALCLFLADYRADADEGRTVTVYAAASLKDALEETAKAFEEKSGVSVRYSFASSSTLARQISLGAPAEIYASANPVWTNYLDARGHLVKGSRTQPIGNRLVLIANRAAAEFPSDIIEAIDRALGDHDHLAVGDPDHVPAGIYAREALQSTGQWEEVIDKLARADNVRAALALVARGEAPLGIVYETDALISDEVVVVGPFAPSDHKPIRYDFAQIKGGQNQHACRFLHFLSGARAIEIFQRFGFLVIKQDRGQGQC